MKLREKMYTWVDVQNEGYNPDHADHGSPIEPREIHPFDIDANPDDSVLDDDTDHDDDNRKTEDPQVSDVLEYYNETALKSKQRNALPDEVFGLPRLRAYPLHDKAHVQQAIRMFGHCKDPKDRKILANNIFAAMKKFNVTTKIGKKNALYEYAPEALRESTERTKITGLGKPLNKRTVSDIRDEHMRVNRYYYNTLFYSDEFSRSVKALKEYQFLDYFHPDLCRMDFITRLRTVCGGMAVEEAAATIYPKIQMREPLSLDFSTPVGWPPDSIRVDSDMFAITVRDILYAPDDNWFRISLADDINHTYYCLRLYSIMNEIILDPHFDAEVSLTPQQYGILMDWKQHVQYHYDLYLDAKPDSTEQVRQMQYLWDLFWSCTDNPEDEMAISANIIATVNSMASVRDMVITVNETNASPEMLSREQCSSYLVRDLGTPEDIFLLPVTMQYPIVDKTSVRLAMDMIVQIPEDDRPEYVKNLNRKYKEFGCTFSISADHPYAEYADQNIIDHMSHLLLEGDTAVDDEGTSTNSEKPSVENPWYKRLDVIRGLDTNVLDNKELGPNTKKQQEPDYTPHDSIL